MRLAIRHVTTYDYDQPVAWGLQQVRMTPKPHKLQKVLRWDIAVEGGRSELSFEDQHRNLVHLLSLAPDARRLQITSEGEVEVTDANGVLGLHGGWAPLWYFDRVTPRTRAGAGCRRLVQSVAAEPKRLLKLHDLSAAILEALPWEAGASEVTWTAEEAIAAGKGVCQDHAHVFIACARAMGIPARYVSGYLLPEEGGTSAAGHAWAEAWIEDLGWVGYDIANQISPDGRYVRVATGLDYSEAAPVTGARRGAGGETLTVAVDVVAQ
jgi:transglutaminase-like putative cysteine protease